MLALMNEIKIVFSQKLEIDPTEFVATWNNTPECRDIAEAQLTQPAKTQFADPSIMVEVVKFMVNIDTAEFAAGAIAGGALHDGFKAGVGMCVAKVKNKITSLKYKKVEQPDGSQLTKISQDKDDTPPIK